MRHSLFKGVQGWFAALALIALAAPAMGQSYSTKPQDDPNLVNSNTAYNPTFEAVADPAIVESNGAVNCVPCLAKFIARNGGCQSSFVETIVDQKQCQEAVDGTMQKGTVLKSGVEE